MLKNLAAIVALVMALQNSAYAQGGGAPKKEPGGTPSKVTDLSNQAPELKAAFNQAKGSVRMIVILSPTGPVCVKGARVVQSQILDKIQNKNLKVFVVWLPVFGKEGRAQAVDATKLIPDKRAVHFWDPEKKLGFHYGKIVELPMRRGNRLKLAWDIYFAFDRESVWTKHPPAPSDWMHQLGKGPRRLDGAKLRQIVSGLLK